MKRLRDSRVSSRLYISFFIYVYFILSLVFIAFFISIQYGRTTEHFYSEKFLAIDFLVEADRDSYQSNLATAQLFRAYNRQDNDSVESLRQSIIENRRQTWDRFQNFSKLAGDSNETVNTQTARFEQYWKAWEQVSDRIMTLASQGNEGRTAANDLYYSDSYTAAAYDPMRDSMDQLTNFLLDEADSLHRSTGSSVALLQNVLILFVVLVVVYTFFLIIILGWMIFKPVKTLIARVEQIAKGDADLTMTVAIKGRNEYGRLAQGFNEFTEGLRKAMADLKSVAELNVNLRNRLGTSAEEVSATVIEITANLGSIGKQVDGLDATISGAREGVTKIGTVIDSFENQVEEQASMVAESTAAVTQMIASVNNVAGVAEKQKGATDDLVKKSEEGNQKISATSGAVNSIRQSLDSIKEMMSIIASIASQTNLLAMNAAIEAAHAGEAGKGFAVVADEIRKLAESTGEQSKRISGVLKEIAAKISAASSASEASKSSFDTIFSQIGTVAEAFAEISTSMMELQTGGKQILEAMTSLQNVSETVKNGTIEIRDGMTSFSEQMSQVSRVSGEVVNAISEISAGTAEISTALNEVANLAGEMGESTNRLAVQVNRFKT